jgi:hypothetical protein
VTTLQAAVLMVFNGGSGAALPFSHIAKASGLSEDVLKRVLHSLACVKYKVLKRTAATPPGSRIILLCHSHHPTHPRSCRRWPSSCSSSFCCGQEH